MAFISMVFVALFIVGAILLGIGLIGLIITIVSVIKRRRTPEGVKKKKAGLIVGIILMSVPVVPVAAILIYGAYSRITLEIQRANYTCLTDEWRNEYVPEDKAAKAAMEAMLKAADEGDKEEIKAMFSENAQNEQLDKQIDQFLATYPGKLLQTELPEDFLSEYACDYSKTDWSESSENGFNKEYFSVCFDVEMDGERYYISMEGCNHNDNNPEEIGLLLFTVETELAYVVEKEYSETDYIYSDMMQDADFEVRKIDGKLCAFTPINRKISQEEALETLREKFWLEDYIEKYGEANAVINYDKESGDGEYYYELLPENGEARYLKLEVEDDDIDASLSCICGEEKGNEIWLDEFWKDEFQKDEFQKEKNEISGDEEREQ